MLAASKRHEAEKVTADKSPIYECAGTVGLPRIGEYINTRLMHKNPNPANRKSGQHSGKTVQQCNVLGKCGILTFSKLLRVGVGGGYTNVATSKCRGVGAMQCGNVATSNVEACTFTMQRSRFIFQSSLPAN